MRFELDTVGDSYIISSYEPGSVTIDKQIYSKSLIVSSKKLILDWNLPIASLYEEFHWQPFLDLEVTTVLLGLGETQKFLNDQWLEWFYKKGIGLEVMVNRSACYTYNALISEGRNVALGLIL